MCDGAFLTEEYTYDARILKEFFLDKLSKYKNVNILYNTRIEKIIEKDREYILYTNHGLFYICFY